MDFVWSSGLGFCLVKSFVVGKFGDDFEEEKVKGITAYDGAVTELVDGIVTEFCYC